LALNPDKSKLTNLCAVYTYAYVLSGRLGGWALWAPLATPLSACFSNLC